MAFILDQDNIVIQRSMNRMKFQFDFRMVKNTNCLSVDEKLERVTF